MLTNWLTKSQSPFDYNSLKSINCWSIFWLKQSLSQFQIHFISILLESYFVWILVEFCLNLDQILSESLNLVWISIKSRLNLDQTLLESRLNLAWISIKSRLVSQLNFVWILIEPQLFNFIYLFIDKMSDKISICKLIGQSNYEVWSLCVQSFLVHGLLSDVIVEGTTLKLEVD